jgi:hypothetical protein
MVDNRPVGDVLQSLDLDMAFPEAVTSGIFYNNYATQFHIRATHHSDLYLRSGVPTVAARAAEVPPIRRRR